MTVEQVQIAVDAVLLTVLLVLNLALLILSRHSR